VEEISGISGEFLSEYLTSFGSSRGCALLGKTPFDKLKAVKDFLTGRDCQFEAINCRKEARDADSVIKMAEKHQNTPYVIFNHCEDILCRDDVFKIFAHLLDADEYDVWFPTESFYVFLGDKNTIPQRAGFPAGSYEEDHIASFCTYVNCYDFDAGKRFMGQNDTSVKIF
jgi:glutaredoxin